MNRTRTNKGLGLVVLIATGLIAPAAGAAVVVESVDAENGAARAGLRPGDVLVGWDLTVVVSPPASSTSPASGSFDSPFDLQALESEQRHLGTVWLALRRSDQVLRVEMGIEQWRMTSRPDFAAGDRARYELGKSLLATDSERAFEVWSQLASDLETKSEPVHAAWLLLTMCQATGAQEEGEQALEYCDRAARQARDARHTEAEARILRGRGELLEEKHDLEEADAAYRAALAVRRDAAQRGETSNLAVAQSLSDLGTLCWQRGDLDASYELLAEARQIREAETPGSLAVAAALNLHAIPTLLRGDYVAGAQDVFRSFEMLQGLAPESHEMAKTSNTLGILEARRGRIEEAKGHYLRALRIVERLDPGGDDEAAFLTNLGELNLNSGDLASAEAFAHRARAIQAQIGPRSRGMAATLTNLAAIRSLRGELEQALGLRQQAVDIWEEVAPEHFLLPLALSSICNLAVDLGRPADAEASYDQALKKLASEKQQGLQAAVARQELGSCRARLGEWGSAERLQQEALERIEAMLPGSLHEAQSLIGLGEVRAATGRLELARSDFERALEISERLSPEGPELVASLHGLANLESSHGNVVASSHRFEQAIDALEELSRHVGGDYEDWARFQERNSILYRDYIRLLIESGRASEAFEVLERSRARAFLNLLAAQRRKLPRRIPGELASAYDEAAASYDLILSELAAVNAVAQEERLEEIRSRLTDARTRRDELRGQVWSADSRLAEVEHPRLLSAQSAAAILDAGTLLLSFFVDRDASFVFALGPDPGEFAVHRIESGEGELATKVNRFRGLLGRLGSPETLRLLAKNLGQLLLEPAADAISRSQRILVAPDGPLHGLPFAALGHPARPGSLLIEGGPLTVVDSATVYSQLVARRAYSPPSRLVAFGDPIYPARKGLPAGDDPVLRSALDRGTELAALPATRAEVEAIAALFPAGAEVFLGKDATEENVKASAKDAQVLHLACHAVVDERSPLESALLLTVPESRREGAENGVLQAWEILEQVELTADLVTLSACETARGTQLAGEGLIGLTRAFQFAGARAVLASLWAVGDKGTAELMTRFYGYLTSGVPTDLALQRAQLDLLSARDTPKRFRHPFFWAAFELFGDWR